MVTKTFLACSQNYKIRVLLQGGYGVCNNSLLKLFNIGVSRLVDKGGLDFVYEILNDSA